MARTACGARPAAARAPRRLQVLAGLFFLAGAIGCETPVALPKLPGIPAARSADARSDRPAVVDRPEQSAAYDVLVGELASREGDAESARAAFERAIEKDPESAQLHLRLALLAAQTDDMDAALGYARRAMELDPEDDRARIFLGRLHRMRRDGPAAEAALLRDGEPVNTAAALMLAQIYLEQGDAARALELSQQAVALEPDSLRAHLTLARSFEELGDAAEAEASLRAALRHHPGEMAIYGQLLRRRRIDADTEGEIALYHEILELRPDHYGTLTDLGEVLRVQGRPDEARAIYLRLLEHYPQDLPAAVRLAAIDAEAGRTAEAADRLESLLPVRGARPELAIALAQLRRDLGQRDRARAALERVPDDHDRWFDARLQISSLLEADRDYVGARRELEALRTVKPSRALDFHLAGLRARTGDLPGGVALLESHLVETPNDPEVLYQLGVVYGIAQRFDDAIGYMEASLEYDGDNAQALNYIGYTLAERGERLDHAEAMITRALELRPEDGYITDSLGWVYYQRARAASDSDRAFFIDRAVEHLETAAELTGGDPVIAEHLGDVYQLKGDAAQALRFYLEAVALEPRFDEQPELADKIEALGGERPTP